MKMITIITTCINVLCACFNAFWAFYWIKRLQKTQEQLQHEDSFKRLHEEDLWIKENLD